MASKKGLAATVAVLGVITVASFMVWIIPQGAIITVSDHGDNFERIQQINLAVTDGMESDFRALMLGDSETEEYVRAAQASSAQLRAEIIDLTKIDAPEEWRESYQKQADSIRLSITYARETIAAAEKIAGGGDASDTINGAEDLLERTRMAAAEASAARPDA